VVIVVILGSGVGVVTKHYRGPRNARTPPGRAPATFLPARWDTTRFAAVSPDAPVRSGVETLRNTASRAAHRALAVALGILAASCTGKPDGVEPVRPFDIERYAGTWYEIMRLDHSFERGLGNVTATYALRDDGSVSVLNKGFDRATCRWREAQGRAVFQEKRDTASLSVTFFWPFAGGYHVFELDHEGYRWAAVAGPSFDYLWILAREPRLPPALTRHLIAAAKARGFPVEKLIVVDQSDPTCRLSERSP
jgi:apolipoprotein D and lipocalin family protein